MANRRVKFDFKIESNKLIFKKKILKIINKITKFQEQKNRFRRTENRAGYELYEIIRYNRLNKNKKLQ